MRTPASAVGLGDMWVTLWLISNWWDSCGLPEAEAQAAAGQTATYNTIQFIQ